MTGDLVAARGGRGRLSPGAAWAVALAAVVVAVLLRWLIDPIVGESLPLVTLFGAVALAVWVGGWGPAAAACALGYVACSYLFIPPRGSLAVTDIPTAVGLLMYLFTCGLIIAIGQAMHRAERRSSEHRELLRVTLGSIGDAVITTDNAGRVGYLNAVAEKLTGWTLAEALERPLEEVFRIVGEKDRRPLESPTARALRERQTVGLASHTLLIDKHGVERAIDDSAAPILGAAGKILGCVLTFRDISDRRRFEIEGSDRLLAAKLLASIVETSDDAIISKSLDGIIRSWNAGAERLFGYTAEQAVGRHISLVIPPDRVAEEEQIIARLRAGQRVDHFETERLRDDGSRLLVSLTISPIKDGGGNVIGASKIARDITERRRMEDRLRALAENLAEVDRRKNEFLATLSHELRNPLAPMRNTLEVLKRGADGVDTADALDVLERQLAQLVRLVDDLLDLNRITHNRIDLRLERVELAPVIEQAAIACRSQAECAGVEIAVDLPGEPMVVRGDAVRLAQVFGNLLNNGCKYNDVGGTVGVTAERQGNQATIRVADSGNGIPRDQLDSIFEMFTQLDRSLERSRGGLGIGLTLVKRLIEMHGGTVIAESPGEGLGSTFTVQLPLVAAAVEAAQPTPVVVASPRRSRRILVVDDNRDAAASLALLLQLDGNETFEAHDGEAALAAAERHRPEVVLLDIGLPMVNGYDVCRRLREQNWGAAITIIALTGWGQEEDRRISREAGFDGHLVKPVDFPALLKLLSTTVAARETD